MSVEHVLARQGPRRLLSLDGGGIRGALTIEILARIESLLRERSGRPDLVLADYFDYIGGTSTGAIIAACLAVGKSVDTIRGFYRENSAAMFAPAGLLSRIRNKFTAKNLSVRLRAELGDETRLGDASIRTLLMLVLRNATTDSPWPVSNNPRAMFNARDYASCNLEFPLWQLVRASAAAPTFFEPEEIEVEGHRFVFVDGGVTTFNNPAFQLFLMATAAPYRLNWPTGEDQMLLVSVGTGGAAAANMNLSPMQMHLLYNVQSLPSALISAAMNQQDMLCRAFGRCMQGRPIDTELGDMRDGATGGMSAPEHDACFQGRDGAIAKMFTYLRYDADLSREGLDRLGLADVEPKKIQQMDCVANLDALQEIGRRISARDVYGDVLAQFLPVDGVPGSAGLTVSPSENANVRLLDGVNRTGRWFRAKKTGPVWVRVAETRESVQTLEGIEHVDAGGCICRGEAGDLWPQSAETLASRYGATDDVDAAGWRKYIPRTHAPGVMAASMPDAFVVQSRWGALRGKAGDYLVKNYADRDVPYPDDVWVVDQALFGHTYEPVTSDSVEEP